MIRPALLALLACTLPATAQIATAQVTGHGAAFSDRFSAIAPLPASQRGPTLKPAVTVIGEIVRIGDLVENAGTASHVAIFRAPDLGQTGRVPTSRVIEAIAPQGLDVDTRGVTEIVVTRASTTITAEDIEARVLKALADRQRGTAAGNLTLTFDGEFRTIHVEPATELRIARLSFEPRSGRFDVLFEHPGGGRRMTRVTGTYAETFEAAVLAHPLTPGAVVKASDVTLVRRPKSEFAANVITNPAQAIGQAVRRAMRPGDLLRQTDLAKPEVVSRNDNVTITYDVPGITLTMRGKALEAGAHGETINVLNEHSKRSIQATIAGRGHVVVTATPRVNVTSTTTAPRLAADTTGRPNPQTRASAE